LHEALYEYRVHDASLSRRREAEQFRAAERLWRAHVHDLRGIDRRNLAEIWMFLAYAKLRSGNLPHCALYALRALLIDPPGFVRRSFGISTKALSGRGGGRVRAPEASRTRP
jgi:hypothetical protein